MQKSIQFKRDTLSIGLIIAAAFALAAFGFFLAVLLGNGRTTVSAPQELTIDQKNIVMDSLAKSEVAPSTGAASSSATTTQKAALKAGPPVTTGQADSHDQYAAAKLQILQSLNSK